MVQRADDNGPKITSTSATTAAAACGCRRGLTGCLSVGGSSNSSSSSALRTAGGTAIFVRGSPESTSLEERREVPFESIAEAHVGGVPVVVLVAAGPLLVIQTACDGGGGGYLGESLW